MQLNKDFVSQIQRIIANAQVKAIRSVNFERVLMYWQIGEAIVEEEQNGKERAEYGAYLIETLAKELQPQFGSGFSKRQLYRYVQFYKHFPIVSALRTQLSWTHYKALLGIDSEQKREFYIAETDEVTLKTLSVSKEELDSGHTNGLPKEYLQIAEHLNDGATLYAM